MFKKMFASIIMFVLISFSECALGEELMKIYYIPFRNQTYLPVTVENIEEKSLYTFNVPAHSDLAIELTKLLNSDIPGVFDYYRVRLKMVKGNTSYYVDTKGNIINISNKISKTNVEDLKSVLNKMITKYQVKRTH